MDRGNDSHGIDVPEEEGKKGPSENPTTNGDQDHFQRVPNSEEPCCGSSILKNALSGPTDGTNGTNGTNGKVDDEDWYWGTDGSKGKVDDDDWEWGRPMKYPSPPPKTDDDNVWTAYWEAIPLFAQEDEKCTCPYMKVHRVSCVEAKARSKDPDFQYNENLKAYKKQDREERGKEKATPEVKRAKRSFSV